MSVITYTGSISSSGGDGAPLSSCYFTASKQPGDITPGETLQSFSVVIQGMSYAVHYQYYQGDLDASFGGYGATYSISCSAGSFSGSTTQSFSSSSTQQLNFYTSWNPSSLPSSLSFSFSVSGSQTKKGRISGKSITRNIGSLLMCKGGSVTVTLNFSSNSSGTTDSDPGLGNIPQPPLPPSGYNNYITDFNPIASIKTVYSDYVSLEVSLGQPNSLVSNNNPLWNTVAICPYGTTSPAYYQEGGMTSYIFEIRMATPPIVCKYGSQLSFTVYARQIKDAQFVGVTKDFSINIPQCVLQGQYSGIYSSASPFDSNQQSYNIIDNTLLDIPSINIDQNGDMNISIQPLTTRHRYVAGIDGYMTDNPYDKSGARMSIHYRITNKTKDIDITHNNKSLIDISDNVPIISADSITNSDHGNLLIEIKRGQNDKFYITNKDMQSIWIGDANDLIQFYIIADNCSKEIYNLCKGCAYTSPTYRVKLGDSRPPDIDNVICRWPYRRPNFGVSRPFYDARPIRPGNPTVHKSSEYLNFYWSPAIAQLGSKRQTCSYQIIPTERTIQSISNADFFATSNASQYPNVYVKQPQRKTSHQNDDLQFYLKAFYTINGNRSKNFALSTDDDYLDNYGQNGLAVIHANVQQSSILRPFGLIDFPIVRISVNNSKDLFTFIDFGYLYSGLRLGSFSSKDSGHENRIVTFTIYKNERKYASMRVDGPYIYMCGTRHLTVREPSSSSSSSLVFSYTDSGNSDYSVLTSYNSLFQLDQNIFLSDNPNDSFTADFIVQWKQNDKVVYASQLLGIPIQITQSYKNNRCNIFYYSKPDANSPATWIPCRIFVYQDNKWVSCRTTSFSSK